MIPHLQENSSNYEVAVQILKDNYWDEEAIREDIFSKLFSLEPGSHYDSDFLRDYLSQLKYELAELDSAMHYRFLKRNSGSGALAAHILFRRLPARLREELVRVEETPYPTLSAILDGGTRILKSWRTTQGRLGRNRYQGNNSWQKPRPSGEGLITPTLENFHVTEHKACNLCLQDGHEARNCTKYSTFQLRQQRCRELGLCYKCTSSDHFGDRCPTKNTFKNPCRKCSAYGHTTPMCPTTSTSNGCINTGVSDRQCLLPISKITLRRGNRTVEARCMVDTGSQNSYFSGRILRDLQCDRRSVLDKNLEIVTFLGRRRCRFKQVTTTILFPSGVSRQLPILIDEGLDLHHQIEQLPSIMENLRLQNYKLDTDLGNSADIILDGLLGVDLLQFMGPWEMVKCMNGVAWSTPQGIIPFGDPRSFLQPEQDRIVGSCVTEYQETMNSVKCSASVVNSVLEAVPSYPDPYEDIFTNSTVDRGLEWLYSIESLGLSEEEVVSDYDAMKVKEFMSHIEFKENCYWVQLPWHTDRLAKVDSNYRVALKVLDRVVTDLENKGLYENYLQVFGEQEMENIIEPFECPPELYHKYVWIPHRPVFKLDSTSTTKIRPVFNCSLKVKGGVSLNEAAYPGINLTGDMLNLTLLFRTNSYTLLGDIRKAFLMIRLTKASDRNKFCFFLKQGRYLKCYRYTTLIFGFNASPFILNCILKYHASKFPADECSNVLSSKFYVDNLVTTCDSKSALDSTYQLARGRLERGGFELRSCNTNCPELRKTMLVDGTLTSHGCNWEKVLGYRYDPNGDTISLAQKFCSPDLTTKRLILSAASGIFDPLSLCLPVTIQSRILIGEMWKAGIDWDEQIPEQLSSAWRSLSDELSQLHSLSFKRQVINKNEEAILCIFSDASKKAYGFTVYVIQGGVSSLLFAKAKVAPLKTKTLPTLELLAAFLALKCLMNILKTYGQMKIVELFLAVDSQIVLSWLMSKVTSNKSIFVKNRLKDIMCMEKQILEEYSLKIKYKYVASKQNPADLITRGLTTNKFKENISFWCSGPKWLADKTMSWPDSKLGCLNADNQQVIRTGLFCTVESNKPESIISLDRFSSFKKLLAVMTKVYEFLNKLRGRVVDCAQLASCYLFRIMQSQAFHLEMAYLQNPMNKPVPIKVGQLNMFLDEFGLIRSRGRIGRNLTHKYEVINPLMLGKNHPLTVLIIKDVHDEVKHLGVTTTLSKARLSGFWIPQGRQAVKKILKECWLCRKFNAVPFTYPKLTNLPRHRVNLVRPFLHTGIDYTGHLWICDQGQRSKVYILIFTCMEIRAVHLELVEDMTIRSFILAFTRFSNMWGLPSHLYSDNAKSFVAGGDVLQQVLTADEFINKYRPYNLKHVRIPLHSPWYGGVWERLIKTLKACLYKSIGRSVCGYSELLTTISDIQQAVNNRPLTYVSSDQCGWEVITPNHFLHPDHNPNLLVRLENFNINEFEAPSKQRLIASLKNRDALLQEFKRIWHDDYLLSLREQHQELNTSTYNAIQVGDIVSIKLPHKARPFWALGRVVKLFHGDDGLVRSAEVMQGDGTIHNHALMHLYPLELQAVQTSENNEDPMGSEDNIEEHEAYQADERLWICPECDLPDDGSAMVCCDSCDFWFHFRCVSLRGSPEEDEWFCPSCTGRD